MRESVPIHVSNVARETTPNFVHDKITVEWYTTFNRWYHHALDNDRKSVILG